MFRSNLSEITIYIIWTCIFKDVFYWLPYQTESYLHQYAYAGFVQLLVSRHLFQTRLGYKETDISYVASGIPFSVFLELPCNSTLYSYVTV